jgi:Uma2 family endonuclease
MSTRTNHLTADDLLRMPDDGKRRELVVGKLREMPPSGHEHGRVAMRFSGPLSVFVEENDLGAVYAAETGFLLAQDPDTIRGPDMAFVTRERVAAVPGGQGYFPGAPDLAVEVVSPGDTYSEVEAKVGEWFAAGCRMVVVANPRNRTVKVYRSITEVTILIADDTFDGGDVVPGFRILVRRIFPE